MGIFPPEDPRSLICTKFGTAAGLADLITHDNVFGNRLKGFDSVRVEFCHFPISRLSPLTQCCRYCTPVLHRSPLGYKHGMAQINIA